MSWRMPFGLMAGRGGPDLTVNTVVDSAGDTVIVATGHTVIAKNGEPDSLGVPNVLTAYGPTAEDWWVGHWANPESAAYISPGLVRLHSNEVSVSGADNLQTKIDAAPDNTTFVLAAGYSYLDPVLFTGRNGLHFVSADPSSPAEIGSIMGVAHSIAETSYTDFVTAVLDNSPAAARTAFLNLPRDLIFRDIAFTSNGTPYVPESPSGTAPWGYGPLIFTGYRDVLIERCSFNGYTAADASGDPAGIPASHPGLVRGGGGLLNFVVRNNAFVSTPNAGGFGFPWAVYFDGPQGSVIIDNDLSGTQWHSGAFLLLCNDDFTWDYNGDTVMDRMIDERNAKYNAVYRNRSTNHCRTFVSLQGERNLVAENDLAGQSGSGIAFMELGARCSRLFATTGHMYEMTENVVRDNAVAGLYTGVGFVIHATGQGDACEGSVGITTLTDNAVTGAVTTWIGSSGTVPALTPNVESGNTSA